MKYERFEDLPVWKSAIEFAAKVYALTEKAQFSKRSGLRSQAERAVLSVSNNIAEGFERGTTQELLTFLYIARGSAGEVRSMLCFIEGLPEFKDLRLEVLDLKSLAEGVSRQLRAWADSLQNSGIKGQRYLNDKKRSSARIGKERSEFIEMLEKYKSGAYKAT